MWAERDKRYLDIGHGIRNNMVALDTRGIWGVGALGKTLYNARAFGSQVTWLKDSTEQIRAADKAFNSMVGTVTRNH